MDFVWRLRLQPGEVELLPFFPLLLAPSVSQEGLKVYNIPKIMQMISKAGSSYHLFHGQALWPAFFAWRSKTSRGKFNQSLLTPIAGYFKAKTTFEKINQTTG
jgi:hypothetical protein